MFKGSLVALITPYKKDALDEQAIEALVEWQISEGTQGIVTCGSTGEGLLLTQDEQKRVLDICMATAKRRVPVIANITALTVSGVPALARQAEKAEAQGMMLMSPPYSRPTQDGLFQFVKRVHDETHLPLIIYNNPARCVVAIAQETIINLAKLPRIVGFKDSGGDIATFPLLDSFFLPDFVQLCGEDALNAAFVAQGGDGWISVTANAAPQLCAHMYHAWEQGNLKEFARIRDLLIPLHKALFVETNPSPVKYAVACQGFCSDDVRLPLLRATEKTREAVNHALDHAGIIHESWNERIIRHG